MNSGFIEKDDSLYVDDVAVSDIAKKVPTPFYVYSAQKIKDNYKALYNAFLNVMPESSIPLIAYATKANSNLSIINLLGNLGAGADVVTGGELLRAIKAGIIPEKIVFSGVGKTDEEIILAIDHDIKQINVESMPEMERIEELSKEKNKKTRIAFRLNPDVDAETHEKITTGKDENKFGLNRNQVMELYKYASDSEWLQPVGISVHIGSQLTKMKPFEESFKITADVVKSLKNEGFEVKTTDLGGGIGIVYNNENTPSIEEYAKIVKDIIYPLGTEIIIEPGRMIVGNAGALISRVTYVKHGKSRKYVIVDAGMNDLMRPALYDAFHPICSVKYDNRESEIYDIVGPICETGDSFAIQRNLQPVKRGDLIAILCSGAYGHVMASNYNSRLLPAEIIVEGDSFRTIRKRQSFEDIIKLELF